MSMVLDLPSQAISQYYPEGFASFDRAHQLHGPSERDRGIYGAARAIIGTQIIETPPDVIKAGHILTNPSQIIKARGWVGDVEDIYDVAYFRREPPKMHLGHTISEPYAIVHSEGQVRLEKFAGAMTVPGEDPRLIENVKRRGIDGKVYSGWGLSTVVVTPPPLDNPNKSAEYKQVIRWGKRLDNLEIVAELPGIKNTCFYPVNSTDDDTSLDFFGRPFPHISYGRIKDLTVITVEEVNSGLLITKGKIPKEGHVGVNLARGVNGQPNHRMLDVHEAYAPWGKNGKELNYRLSNYGFELPCKDLPEGRLTLLGVIATRGNFPDAEPKEPSSDVADYRNILYGCLGENEAMVTGVSDRHIGYARVSSVR